MTTLTDTAIATLAASDVNADEYTAVMFPGSEEWLGDACGCVDDRCIGYHHDETDECHCLPAWLEDIAGKVDVLRDVGFRWDLDVLLDRLEVVPSAADRWDALTSAQDAIDDLLDVS